MHPQRPLSSDARRRVGKHRVHIGRADQHGGNHFCRHLNEFCGEPLIHAEHHRFFPKTCGCEQLCTLLAQVVVVRLGHSQITRHPIKSQLLFGNGRLKHDHQDDEDAETDHEHAELRQGAAMRGRGRLGARNDAQIRSGRSARGGRTRQYLRHCVAVLQLTTSARTSGGCRSHAETSHRCITRNLADAARGLRRTSSLVGVFATRTLRHARGAVRDGWAYGVAMLG